MWVFSILLGGCIGLLCELALYMIEYLSVNVQYRIVVGFMSGFMRSMWLNICCLIDSLFSGLQVASVVSKQCR